MNTLYDYIENPVTGRQVLTQSTLGKTILNNHQRISGLSVGGGNFKTKRNKHKYGIQNGKIIKVYPHKIKKKIGRHNYYILWKTTKTNLPGKTYHGKFYVTKVGAQKNGLKQAPKVIEPTYGTKAYVDKVRSQLVELNGRWGMRVDTSPNAVHTQVMRQQPNKGTRAYKAWQKESNKLNSKVLKLYQCIQ